VMCGLDGDFDILTFGMRVGVGRIPRKIGSAGDVSWCIFGGVVCKVWRRRALLLLEETGGARAWCIKADGQPDFGILKFDQCCFFSLLLL
jgi:hypothetical protein